MTTTHTISERLAMLATALVSLAVAAFVTARIYPVRHVLTTTEARSSIGLLLAAALLMVGVVLIVDWRRKRRADREHDRMFDEEIDSFVDPDQNDGFEMMDALADLNHHLTGALAVLLREPSLTIDALTLRMLARHKARTPVVRDEKGRWRKVQ